MIYMSGLRILAISMRSAILFILSRIEFSTDVLVATIGGALAEGRMHDAVCAAQLLPQSKRV
jgi:hypothetical protein